MASLSVADAANFSPRDIPPRFYLDQRPTSQLFEMLPFAHVAAHELRLNYVAAGSLTGDVLQPLLMNNADAEAAGAAIEATMPDTFTVTFPIRRISAEMPVDGIVTELYGADETLLKALVDVKIEAVRDRFKQLMITGTGTDPQLRGIDVLATMNGRTFVANNGVGGSVLAGEMEKLLGLLDPRVAGRDVYFVMHAKTYRHLVRNNYPDAEYRRIDPLGWVPVIAGAPVLIDNFIPTNVGAGSDTTSVYAVVLGEDKGLCGISPMADRGGEIAVKGPFVKATADAMWFHVSWNAGLALYNKGALARMSGVQHAN